jgi:hypothetical protein
MKEMLHPKYENSKVNKTLTYNAMRERYLAANRIVASYILSLMFLVRNV